MPGPRLLPKKLVNVELATQKKQQIDQGLALAKKVDAVRETLGEEEQRLETFRTQSIARVQQEIDANLRQKESLEQAIRQRKEELGLLQIPLDKQWEEANKARKICTEWESRLRESENLLLLRELEVKANLKETSDKLRHTELTELQTEEKKEQAERYLRSAHEKSAEMRNLAQELITSAELREKIVVERENGYQAVVEATERKASELAEKEADIARREKVLADRYTTLSREIKRLQT